jgi:hypothetical protein
MQSNNIANRRMQPVLKLDMPKNKSKEYQLRSILGSPAHKKDLSLYPDLTSIRVLDDFFSYLTTTIDFSHEKALLVFDVDEVLIYNRRVDVINSKYFLSTYAVNCINELAKHADVICLTARNEECRVDLEELCGIKLLQPYNQIKLSEDLEKDLNKYGYSYHDNIIYTNMLAKGTALEVFYSNSKTPYDKVIFLDDSKNNCIDVLCNMADNKKPIASCHLINTEIIIQKAEKSILNTSGYPLKEQPYFNLDTVHNYSTLKNQASPERQR